MTALFLAQICLGISGGVTLNHTDDLASVLRFHAGSSVVSHALADAAPVSCLACQWENSLFSPQVPAVSVACLPLIRLPMLCPVSRTRFPHPFDHTSPRAPPRFFC